MIQKIKLHSSPPFFLAMLLFCTCFSFNTAFAQTSTEEKTDTIPKKASEVEEKDSTVIKLGDVEIVIKDKKSKEKKKGTVIKSSSKERSVKRVINLGKVKTRWVMLDVGISTYLQDGSFNLSDDLSDLDLNYGRSWNVNFHLFRQRVSLIKQHVNLLYGLGFEFNGYNFDKNISLTPNSDSLNYVIADDVTFKKNKLKTTFLQFPIMLNFESNPRKMGKSLHLSAGVYGGLLLGSKTKQKSNDGKKTKITDGFNLNKFRYGLIGQAGIGPINFYATYALNGLFQKGQGPELTPLNIGFTIIPF